MPAAMIFVLSIMKTPICWWCSAGRSALPSTFPVRCAMIFSTMNWRWSNSAAQRRPTLGVCLGAQVIARALGADVISLGVKEIGFAPLTTLAAQDDSPLAPLADTPVLHWHGDMFTIPEGARCGRHGGLPASGLRLSGVCARPAVPSGGRSSRYRTLADWPCLRAGTGRRRAPKPA